MIKKMYPEKEFNPRLCTSAIYWQNISKGYFISSKNAAGIEPKNIKKENLIEVKT